MLSRCVLDFPVGVGAFVIGLSQISSFFSFVETTIKANKIGQYNRDWGVLVGKCINKRTQGRSRKGRS